MSAAFRRWTMTAMASVALALVAAATASPTCVIEGASSQILLYQTRHFTVVASPSDAVSLDLSSGYPPAPGQKAPYVYPTNFHPSGAGAAEAPLHVRICPVGLPPNAIWNLQLAVDDLVDVSTNAVVPADELAYRRRLLGAWTSGSAIPTIVYTGQGHRPVDLYFYFEARLSGGLPAGAYQGALHFTVLAQ